MQSPKLISEIPTRLVKSIASTLANARVRIGMVVSGKFLSWKIHFDLVSEIRIEVDKR